MSSRAKIIDGKAIAASLLPELKEEALAIREKRGRFPSLTVLLVGDNPASASYVKAKESTSAKVGIDTTVVRLPASITQSELISTVRDLSKNEECDGILAQLPLPSHINEDEVIDAISPSKDVDGLHVENAGLLLQGQARFVPATPLGVLRLIRETKTETRGAHVVVVGRSKLVGMPLVPLLGARGTDATVTITHTKTKNLARHTRLADILIVAAGSPEAVSADMVKLGAVVVDVGVNRVLASERKRGYRLVGDVKFEETCEVASAITPVPGGVGPMTVAMLASNVILAAKLSL